ncbi:MAG: phosphate transport regulator, partial [Burkholderiaceae bacterium]
DRVDRDRVRSFMRGLHRTAPLKFDHPGLDTAATRDGHQLVLQNDIGTNDAHVLVIHIEDLRIVLTYSDLHERRFEFFRDSLSELGAVWSVVGPRVTSGLNEGAAYFVGTATFTCDNLDSLDRTLEELGSRIVFLIDWNRTRKRLQQFVSKPCAIDILNAVARAEVGHMGWLKAGGERLLFSAMQAAGDGVFRLGDRLDAVLSESGARQFLIDTMSLASRAVLNGQPIALIEDETRVLLTRYLQSWASEFDLASEHAAYCHELAMAVRDALAHGYNRKEEAKVTVRTKSWERRADDLVEQAREAAKLHPRWQHFAHLIELADNIADNLEEAAFVFGVIVEEHEGALKNGIRESMLELANSVLNATKDYVKALTVARTLAHATDLDASSAFLDATWRVVLAEKSCDEQLRTVRRLIMRELSKAPEVILTTDLANRLEQASDALMIVSYALRDVVLAKTGAVS